MAISEVRFRLEITSGNAAVVDDPSGALSSALRSVAESISIPLMVDLGQGYIRDVNGNRIGFWSVALETDEGDE